MMVQACLSSPQMKKKREKQCPIIHGSIPQIGKRRNRRENAEEVRLQAPQSWIAEVMLSSERVEQIKEP